MTSAGHVARVRLLAEALGAQPSADELADLAAAMAAVAISSTAPGRSVALMVRHRMSRFEQAVQGQVRAMARAELAGMVPPGAPDVIDATWASLDDAAAILALPRRYILARLPDPVWRRAWGWPRWVGPRHTGWLFARAAIDGATAAATLAAVPNVEPPYPLPDWCQRASASEGEQKCPR